MPQQGFINPNNNTAGVDTLTPISIGGTTYDYLTSPAGNNKLPTRYPVRGNNKPLAVLETVTRGPGGRTVTNKTYNEMAFGKETNGTIKTENPYKNNYKKSLGGKFDSRYPSIWRAPKGINYVRGLDDWERAALDAALGRTWTPTTGPGTGSTPPAPSPAPSPSDLPAPAPDSSPPDSSPPDSSPPDSSPPDSSPPDSSPPDSSGPPPADSPAPDSSPPDSPPPVNGPQITIYGGYDTTFTPLPGMNNSTNPFTSFIFVVSSDGNVNRYFFIDPNDPDQNTIELSNEDTDGYLLYNNKYRTSQTKTELDNLVITDPIELTDAVDSITYNRISIAAATPSVVGGRKQKNKSRRFRKHFRKTRKSFKE
jgi:hypothetical protein